MLISIDYDSPARMEKYLSKINIYGRMIKIEHTIFALPFALAALLLANKENPVTLRLAFLIVMAVVWARSAGMGFAVRHKFPTAAGRRKRKAAAIHVCSSQSFF